MIFVKYTVGQKIAPFYFCNNFCETALYFDNFYIWPPKRPDLSPVDYRLFTVIRECIYQKQKGASNIVDELRLLTE